MDAMKLFRCISSLLFLFLLLSSFAFAEAGKYLVYVGTYTEHGSKGIYAYRYDVGTGQFEDLGVAAETPSPSFLAISPNHKFLYAVNELNKYEGKASGIVSAFSIDAKTAKLTLLNQVASMGASPCHISFDRTGKFVMVANYTGGNISVFPVGGDGRVGEASDFIQHQGSGPNHARQEKPHAHWIDVSADNRYVLNADLGLDEILVYRFDAIKGKLTPNNPPFAKVAPGAGPRHLAFHPNGKFAYVIDEMGSTITAFSYDTKKGKLKELQAVSTLPKDFSGENDTAEIVVHPSGKFLYGSNRGHDSLAIFAIDPTKGALSFVEHASVKGKTPRNFEIDPSGKRLLVANQDTNNIVEFTIDQTTGKLTATGTELKVPTPVCIKFLATE
jgi:6-phosphogluconolactonase